MCHGEVTIHFTLYMVLPRAASAEGSIRAESEAYDHKRKDKYLWVTVASKFSQQDPSKKEKRQTSYDTAAKHNATNDR